MEFLELSKTLTDEELHEAEEEIGILFTQDFKDHYKKYNGGYPARRYYLWPKGERTRINHFFSIKHEGFTQLEQVYMNLFVLEKILPVGFLPFAADDGGNLFCISMLPDTYNKVLFCDIHHYNAENSRDYFTLISDSFNDFIENLVS